MLFADGEEAGRQLAKALEQYKGMHALVLALPRGGVSIGRVLADALDADLDVVLVRKIGAPGNPEFAIGAVAEDGWTYVALYAEAVAADSPYVESVRSGELERIRQRRSLYTPGRTSASAAGRLTIIVDGGLATGATMITALHAVHEQAPSRLVCALPVASPEGLQLIRTYADEVVCLHAPPGWGVLRFVPTGQRRKRGCRSRGQAMTAQ